jgi:uncharacterized protein YbjT (DUF2867 family)
MKQFSMILAVGAAGNYAGLVVPELAKRGARVRGMVRKKDQVEEARKNGATEVTVADLSDRASADEALNGVDAVFYIAPAFLPNEAEAGKRMVDAAIRAGVKRFVFSAVIHPVLGIIGHTPKADVENAVLNSDLEYTFLHPTVFFQNYAMFWPKVLEAGVLAEPWSPDTRFARVDYRDVAEVAAIALTEDRLLYGTFELCAPGILNRWEVAKLIGEVLGCEIKAERLDPSALGDIPQGLKEMFDHYEHHGLLGNPLTLRTILGREPRTLRAYFEELAAQRKG